MTDEQIIKALECCSDLECSSCTECPLFMVGKECPIVLHSNALTLIKLQRERIVALRVLYDNECKQSGEARAEAIREFAERVKSYYFDSGKICEEIDAIAREMTEEQK